MADQNNIHGQHQLHWLPVAKRILYKLDTICNKALNNSAPDYLINLLNVYKPSQNLRSVSDPLALRVPRKKLSTFGPRAFSVSGPLSWNQLPLSARQSPLSHHLRFLLRFTCFPLFDVVSPCRTVACVLVGVWMCVIGELVRFGLILSRFSAIQLS